MAAEDDPADRRSPDESDGQDLPGYEDDSPFEKREKDPLLHRAVPVTAQLKGYERQTLTKDTIAGVTVAALAIPSAMGYAEVAGLSPVAGLYALLLPVVAYSLLGTSRQLVVGPEGTSAALVAAALAPLAGGDFERYVALAATLALVVGGIYFLARTVRLGWIADYLSRAALVGFIHGVAVVLVCGQLGKLTGVTITADRPGGQILDLLRNLDEVSLTTVATGTISLVVLFVLKALYPKLPAPLVVVVGAIIVSAAADLEAHGVSILGDIPSGLPSIEVPETRLRDVIDLLIPALGIVFATYSDSILTARSFAGKHRQHVDADQELLALGVANVTAGLTQSFPMGNSNSRTAVNEQMGVRTQVAGIVSAIVVALVLLFLTEPMAQLPDAVLGAVIVYAAIGLVSLDDWKAIRAISRRDFYIALAAMTGVIVFGILQGILIAVFMSILIVVQRSARPNDAVLGWVPRLERYADVKLHPSAELTAGVLVYRLDDRLFFANSDYVKGRVREALAGSPTVVDTFVFDAEALNNIDTTGVAALESIITDFDHDDITFMVARLKGTMRERFDQAGLTDRIGESNMFPTVRAAVAAARPANGS
jgi:high affinity sulfate transporter 1